YTRDSSHEDVARKGPLKGHPLTGPVEVRDAAPGDTLVVEILGVQPRAGFGWTAIRPGKGLLPPEQFPNHFLQLWELGPRGLARMLQRTDIAVPGEPFPGIIGTALAAPGAHSTIPPRENGGNMDLKHLTRGTQVLLPVWVPGAMLSIGDAHAAQGDGEVCVTAIEMSASIRVRVTLQHGRALREPCIRIPGPLCSQTGRGPWIGTTTHGPDLHEWARPAVS